VHLCISEYLNIHAEDLQTVERRSGTVLPLPPSGQKIHEVGAECDATFLAPKSGLRRFRNTVVARASTLINFDKFAHANFALPRSTQVGVTCHTHSRCEAPLPSGARRLTGKDRPSERLSRTDSHPCPMSITTDIDVSTAQPGWGTRP
jgi:hypothetical protein